MKRGHDFIGVGVGAIIFKNNKLLLLKRSNNSQNEVGHWENTGGAVEIGETFRQAIKREVMEELGVEINILYKLPIQECFLKKDKQHWITQTYVVELISNQVPKIQEKDKHDDIGWFDIKNLPQPLSIISKKDIENFQKN